jgi:hypothetical protein
VLFAVMAVLSRLFTSRRAYDDALLAFLMITLAGALVTWCGLAMALVARNVRKGGVEPPKPCGYRILSPARLPVPPLSREGCPD